MVVTARDLYTEELQARIVWLIRLRWIAAIGVAITIWAAPRLVYVSLSQQPLYLITLGLIVYNLVLWSFSRHRPTAFTDADVYWFANLQVGIDLVFLTALLHYSGGIENPFVCYYVFHIVIASILLPLHVAFLQVAFAVVLLLGMTLSEALGWLPHYHLYRLCPIELYRDPTYLIAMLFVIVTMLYFTALMATAISRRLRARERQIVQLTDTVQQHIDELEQAYGSLHQLEREKSEYMHRAAHHLRAPLAAMESMLAVVAEGRTGSLPEKAQDMIARTRGRVRGMLELAHDLLILSRAREANQDTARTRVDLHELLAAMEGDFAREAAHASVELHLTGAPHAEVWGVPEALGELLENLISNAIKYTPAGGKVEVSLTDSARGVELCVTDTGIGIPAEEQTAIFEEFYRASNARESTRSGTGLGLAIVKAIAAAHRAEVKLTSTVGAGTEVRVFFPRLEGASHE